MRDAIQSSPPLPLSSHFAFNLAQHQVFSNESALCIRELKYWSFIISPSNEYLGLISFRIDWFDLLAVQGTLKSLLQHHNSKASIVWHSASFMVQLSHLYNYWKNYTFDYMDLVSKSDISAFVSLLFDVSAFVFALSAKWCFYCGQYRPRISIIRELSIKC